MVQKLQTSEKNFILKKMSDSAQILKEITKNQPSQIIFIKQNFPLDLGQGQVEAQPGFQAQPCFQQVQVHVIHGYSIFCPENHFTW